MNIKQKIIIGFLILLFIIIIAGEILILRNIIHATSNTLNTYKMTLSNKLQCPPDIKCQQSTIDLINSNLPTPDKFIDSEWNYDINLYCANLVCRVQYGIEHDKPIISPDQTLLSYIKTDNKDAPIFGTITVKKDSIGKSNPTIWISFRGTITMDEAMTDINYIQTVDDKSKSNNSQMTLYSLMKKDSSIRRKYISSDDKQPMVHQGFLKLYLSFRNTIINTISQYNQINSTKNLKNIYVCGHSLGAAVSTIAGFDLANMGYNVVVYNFASPRVGNQEFCEQIHSQTKGLFRLVNTCDIVPNGPASVSGNYNGNHNPFIFNHCGTARYFTNNWQSILTNHLMGIYVEGLRTYNPNN
jgi:hypothetical protein